jgi:CheY-like chemotaxis protein
MGIENKSRANVLIVDDEEAQCKLLSFLLRRNFEVATALNGEAALALVRQRRFDVAVVDYRMPGMTGTEVLRKMKELQPSCLRILMTAHALPSILEEATSVAGVYRLLSKPVDAEVLRIDLQRALEHQHESGRGGGGAHVPEPPRLGDLARCVARELETIGDALGRARTDPALRKDPDEALAGAALAIGRVIQTLRALPTGSHSPAPQSIADAVRVVNRTWDAGRSRPLDPTLRPDIASDLPPLLLPSGTLEPVLTALARSVGHEACKPTAIMIRARRLESDFVALEIWRDGGRPAPTRPPASPQSSGRVFDADLSLDFNVARWLIETSGGEVSQVTHGGNTQAVTAVIPHATQPKNTNTSSNSNSNPNPTKNG